MPEGNTIGYLPSVVRVRATALITNVVQFTDVVECRGFVWMMLYNEYVRGLAGGAVQLQVQASPALYGGWYPMTAYGVGAVAVNVDTASNIQRNTYIYGATAAGAEGFLYGPFVLGNTVDRIRISFVEVGVPGTPGNWGCDVVFGVDR